MIRKVANYEGELSSIIYESLCEFGLPLKGKTVLLKPNLVGFDPLGVINTHPAVVAAARESFLRLGASQVLIGDGPALDRDTQAIIESVRLREFVGSLNRTFVDLNLDEVEVVPLGRRLFGFHAQTEDTSLGGSDPFAEEHVRCGAGQLLRMAEKYSALGRD